jgi:hypothetical protein
VRKKNQYIENLRRRQEEAARGPQAAETAKPTSQMSEAELDAEVARLEREVRASKERTVELGREELAGQGSKHPIFTKRQRPPWR